MNSINITIIATDNHKRLDSYLAMEMELTRSHTQRLISDNAVFLNGKSADNSSSVSEGDRITVTIPDSQPIDIVAQNIDIDIVYQDADLAVINKSQGMVVHPASGQYTDTLVNALLYHISDLSGINGIIRPGIVHRLDKNTSGLLVVAKNDKAHNSLAGQIQDKTCARIYWAIVEGVVKSDSGTIDLPIGRSQNDRKKMAIDPNGRLAITNYRVVERYRSNTLMEFRLNTGRTHQIRVHSKQMGHPVVGDKEYGYKTQRFNLNGQLLHAKELSFNQPSTGQRLTFNAPLPDYFERILTILQKEQSQ